MRARGVLQAGGLGGLRLGFSLRGLGLRLGFGGDGFALLEMLGPLPDLAAQSFGFGAATRVAYDERDEGDDDDRHDGDDDPDHGVAVHVGSFDLSPGHDD